MNIIVINGMPCSGKSQFVEYCLEELGSFGREVSTVDYIKGLAKEFGWDGQKTPKDRKFLSDLKDLLTEYNDIPYKETKKELDRFKWELETFGVNEDRCFFFIHCREPQEIQKFKEKLGATTLLMRRAVVENKEQSNHADSNVFNYKYDCMIENNGSLKELKEKAHGFIDLMLS